MKIRQKFSLVTGEFDTTTDKMLCIASDKHGTVELCLNEDGCGWNIPIAKIELYDTGLYKDFKATLADAKNLGEEIARRWNECQDKR